jgi:hypothetical protein
MKTLLQPLYERLDEHSELIQLFRDVRRIAQVNEIKRHHHLLLTLHYITLHYITLHYITLHYITLHYITLHYYSAHSPLGLLSDRLHQVLRLHMLLT